MSRKQAVLRYALAYLLWFGTFATTIVCANALRMTYLLLLQDWGWNRYAIRVTDQFALIVMALAVIAVVVATEHLYRTAVPAQRLLRTVSGVLAWQFAILGGAHAVQFVVGLRHGGADSILAAMVIAELAVAAALWWWRRRAAAR